MRAVIQRVLNAKVTVDDRTVGEIGRGILVLVGAQVGDTDADIKYIVDKTANLRIFEDEDDKMNISAMDLGLPILVVSQFTLMGDARKGRRPGFTEAGSPDAARAVFEKTLDEFRKTGLCIETGEYQAHMHVALVNDGPVTILLDSRKNF